MPRSLRVELMGSSGKRLAENTKPHRELRTRHWRTRGYPGTFVYREGWLGVEALMREQEGRTGTVLSTE